MRYVEVVPGQVCLREGPAPAPAADQVRVRVLACGICGSDAHLLRGMVLPRGAAYPVRPGHEVAGSVLEAPSGAAVAPGDLVVLHPLDVCGTCPACRQGEEQRCRFGRLLGLQAPGGMAEEVCWSARRVVPVAGLTPDRAAVLADAVATARHALRLADPAPGTRLCVLGAGGVGSHVIRLAQLLHPGVELRAVVRSRASAQRLEALGVSAVLGLEGAAERLRPEGRFQAVIDFSGTAAGPAEAVRMLEVGGRLVLGSVVDEPIQLGTTVTGVVTRELRVIGCYVSTLADLREVAELASSGRLELADSVSWVLPLERAADAFRLLEERPPGTVRVVLEP